MTTLLVPPLAAAPTITTGVDIASVQRLRQLLDTRPPFALAVFSPDEIAYCRRFRDPAPHFAARFGAKEATLKALSLGLGVPPATRRLRDVEVCRTAGPPRLRLHNRLAAAARRLGVTGAAVALSHDGDYAIAQVLLSWRAPGEVAS
ncbi:holo-ACP synthase [Nocardia sp. CDC159]|uniref:Holo-[acyl-carrier-protein] synthase n=1 Tax=Nocardia pulmonis TaxID=2951408 RepID=A0A9X2EA42_9NOCA|nr:MULTISPECIES: holo-ACP synthase [Nocardia]MCM6775608.1 holo-ACP synthase [Nocardia pulmonis]MCM6787658.1 holo-ACP synthase [Nocardia sp. CDC159]